MDDRFLHEGRRDPDPRFAAELKARLAREDAAAPVAPHRTFPRARAVAPWAAAAAALALLAFPGVRAGAQAFLDLFRVHTFTAVTVDPARLARLDHASIDARSLLGGQITQEVQPGPPRFYANVEEAGRAAGIVALAAHDLPAGWTADSVMVAGESRATVTVDTDKLLKAMRDLDVNDVTLPAGLNGQRVGIRRPAAVIADFRNGQRKLWLVEAKSPEIGLPQGVDLARLGEIGLRILGLDPGEAHRLASTVDWHGTVLVPVPANASSFREVTVRGHKALLVTAADEAQAPQPPAGGRVRHMRNGVTLLWSEGDQVYGLHGDIDPENVLQIANALR